MLIFLILPYIGNFCLLASNFVFLKMVAITINKYYTADPQIVLHTMIFTLKYVVVDIFFRQITTFIKVRVAFGLGLQTL